MSSFSRSIFVRNRVAGILLAILLSVPGLAGAATRTISVVGGNWNALGTWVEGAVPTAADDVVATATSGNLTINVAAACRSFNLTNYTKTVTHAAAVTLSIGDATAGAGNKALVFPAAGWTYTLGNVTTSAISFITTSATAQDVDFGGKTPGNVTFNGAGAKWNVIGAMGGNSNTITLTNGTINVNNATAFGGGTVTINGAVTLDNTTAAAITLTSNNAQNWNSNFTFTGTKDLNLGTGAVAMSATRTLTVNGGVLTAGGIISGVGFGITKSGTGTLVLSGNNAFTGVVTVSAGTLRATTSANALGTGAATLSLNGGTLQLADDTGINFARNTTVAAASTLTSDRITGGAGSTNTLGTLSIGNFQLNITSGTNVTSGTAGITFGATTLSASTPVFDVVNTAVLTLGAIGGNFNMTKQNTGQLTAGGASGRSAGVTTLTAGTLKLSATNGLGTAGTTLALNGGTLDLATDSTVNAYPTTVGGAVTVASDRATNGTGVTHTLGTLSIGNFQLNITSGAAVTSGTPGVTFGATTLSASTPVFDVVNTAVLTLGAIGGNFNMTKQNSGQLAAAGASLRSAGVTTLTAGTLKLSATNGLGTTGTTLTLNGGTLELATDSTVNAYPTTVGGSVTIVSGRATGGAGITHTLGTLSIGSQTLSAVVGSSATSVSAGITFGATTLTGNPTFDVLSSVSPAVPLTLTLGAVGDGAVARTITKANTGILTFGSAATSLVNGTTLNITGGSVNSNNATALGALAAVDVVSGSTFTAGATQTVGTISNGGNVGFGAFTLTIGGTNNLSSTFSGILSGSGTVTKAGTGTLTVSGTVSIGGNFAINAGTLAGTGNVTVNTDVTGSGSAGTINMTGGTFTQRIASAQTFGSNVAGANNWTFNNLTFSNSAVSNLAVTINGTGTGQIIVNGALTVGSGGDTNTTTLDDATNDRILNTSSVTITSKGSLTASNTAVFTVSGDWTNAGAFTASGGTVTFNGAGTQNLSGNTSFTKFIASTVGDTLKFAAGSTTTVTSDLTLQNVTLVSSANGSAWFFTMSGPNQTLSSLSVRDSNASNGNKLFAGAGSTNVSGNVNWDFGAPGKITTIAAFQGALGATIRLTWLSPGDDGAVGTLVNSTFTIEYTTDAVFAAGAAWDPQTAQPSHVTRVLISTTSLAPATACETTLSSLIDGGTYYVRIWTDDAGNQYSPISAGATNWATVSVLSSSMSQNTINFGSLTAGSTNVITTAIVVTNDGNVVEKFQVGLTNPAVWVSTGSGAGTDQFRLTAVFRNSQPVSGDFDTVSDVVRTTTATATTTVFARDADADTEKGFNVAPGQTRNLWFRVEMPPISSTTTAQTIRLTSTALP